MRFAHGFRRGFGYLACIGAGLAAVSGAVAAPGDHAINTKGMGISGRLTVTEMSRDPGEVRYFRVAATGDLDGDGLPDHAVLKVECAAASVQSHVLVSSRNAASGLPTGKRMHKPVTVVKEWGAASSQLRAAALGYDLKAAKGSRAAASADGWTPLDITSGGAALCPTAR